MALTYAQKCLNEFKAICAKGNFPSNRRVSMMMGMPSSTFRPEELSFLEEWLTREVTSSREITFRYDEQCGMWALELLAHFGNPVSKYADIIMGSTDKMKETAVRLACEQNDADTIMMLMPSDYQRCSASLMHTVIIAINRLNKPEFLASLLLSNNEGLVDLVKSLQPELAVSM